MWRSTDLFHTDIKRANSLTPIFYTLFMIMTQPQRSTKMSNVFSVSVFEDATTKGVG